MTPCPKTCSGRKTLFSMLALSALISIPANSLAESVTTSEWNITADRIIHYEDPSSIVAEGNIILEKRVKLPPRVKKSSQQNSEWADLLGESNEKSAITAGEVDEKVEEEDRYKTDVLIEADWLSYDVDNQQIKARGNVKVISDDDTLTANKANVDLNTETGSFADAIIIRKKDELHLEGQTIEKTGLDTYHIEDGWVVTCKVEEGETPPWHFASKDTTIKEGGYAVMHHATFNIKGVPVLYSPYMIVPVKNTRQTGLLLPEMNSSSSGGFGVDVPFFWNLSNSQDITIFPEIYFDRGFMPGMEYRYVRDEYSKGAIMASYLHDDLSGDDKSTSYYQETGFGHSNKDRYWVRGKADHDFGDWVSRLDLDLVSDRDYLTEFNTGYTGYDETDDRFLSKFGRGFDNYTDNTRENLFTVLRSWEGMSLQANLLGYNDARSTAQKNSEEDPLWTLPEVNFSGIVPIGSSSFSFDWGSDYVNYWRQDGIGGNRFDLHPSISTSVPLSPYLESRAELGARETLYFVKEYGDGQWDHDNTQNRLLADFEVEVASPLLRTFHFSDEDNDSLDHRLRPYVRYNYIPDVNQDDLPQFDSVDDISQESIITYGLDNFFSGFFSESERDIGYVKLSQGYSLVDLDDNDNPDDRFTDVNLRLRLMPITQLYLDYETDYNVYGDGFVKHSVEGHYANSRGDYFEVEYSFNNSQEVTDKIEQINAKVNLRLLPQWYTSAKIEQSLSDNETNELNLSLRYTAPCWSVEFQSKQTPSDTRFMVVFNLANIGMPFGTEL